MNAFVKRKQIEIKLMGMRQRANAKILDESNGKGNVLIIEVSWEILKRLNSRASAKILQKKRILI